MMRAVAMMKAGAVTNFTASEFRVCYLNGELTCEK